MPNSSRKRPEQVPRRGNEEVNRRGHLAHVRHPAGDPVAPVGDIGLLLVGRAREVARVAALRAPAVLLAGTALPDLVAAGLMHLEELAARAH
jgi:hypothetical protein